MIYSSKTGVLARIAMGVIATLTLAKSANADPYTVINKGLYFSADANVIEAGGETVDAQSFGLGYRFSRIFEVEAGYYHASLYGAAIDGAYTDLTGHLYWNSTGRLSLFGSVGADTTVG